VNTMTQDVFKPEKVVLAWHERPGGPAVTADCWFESKAIRHVVQKHVCGSEPWKRVLNASVVDSLKGLVSDHARPPASDYRHFVEAVGRHLQQSCGQPLLCRFLETALHYVDTAGMPQPILGNLKAREKILLILPTGAVGFVSVANPWSTGTLVATFLTAFFPRQVGWVVPKRAAKANLERYVLRWAAQPHSSGGRLLPEPLEGVREEDGDTGAATQREYFRFISPESWGFELGKDGCQVWLGPRS
jgi:hypothetical protein